MKITLGPRKNNLFYSRVEVGAGVGQKTSPAPATLYRVLLTRVPAVTNQPALIFLKVFNTVMYRYLLLLETCSVTGAFNFGLL